MGINAAIPLQKRSVYRYVYLWSNLCCVKYLPSLYTCVVSIRRMKILLFPKAGLLWKRKLCYKSKFQYFKINSFDRCFPTKIIQPWTPTTFSCVASGKQSDPGGNLTTIRMLHRHPSATDVTFSSIRTNILYTYNSTQMISESMCFCF